VQKHLLGLESFRTPYQYIAADINNTQSINLVDLVELRKTILGITTQFPNGQKSWRFVPANYVFPDATQPWPFPESIVHTPPGLFYGDFIGVKIGDLTGNVFLNNNEIQTRNPWVLQLNTANQQVVSGTMVHVPIYAHQLQDCLGFQFSAEHPGLEFVSATPGALDPASGIASHQDAITMSWSTAIPVSFESDEILFTLNFIATQTEALDNMLSVGSAITEAEVYVERNGSIEIQQPALSFDQVRHVGEFALHQNTPNPFSDNTTITFDLPEAIPGTFQVLDIYGREVYRVDKHFVEGSNAIEIQAGQLTGPGIYFYHLDVGSFRATRKLVKN
jgi:hypothetical protein